MPDTAAFGASGIKQQLPHSPVPSPVLDDVSVPVSTPVVEVVSPALASLVLALASPVLALASPVLALVPVSSTPALVPSASLVPVLGVVWPVVAAGASVVGSPGPVVSSVVAVPLPLPVPGGSLWVSSPRLIEPGRQAERSVARQRQIGGWRSNMPL